MLKSARKSSRIYYLLSLALIIAILYISFNLQESKVLEVHFIDVGQADSILIKTPDGNSILIDGGNNADGPGLLSYLKKEGIKEFMAIIATHPHEDHIGGLDTIINAYPVKEIYLPAVTTNTKTFEDFINAVNNSNAKRIKAEAGVRLNIPDVSGVFLAPCSEKYDNLNEYSAVLRLVYKDTAFLFTGDVEAVSESQILLSQVELEADILKVAHHGSNSSTTPSFLKNVSPIYAIISVGKGNRYGHPSKQTLERLIAAGVKIYRTDEVGTIVVISDGKNIEIEERGPLIQSSASR